ncbi:MAG: hypothetical protein II956_12905 [Bacteroidales bacterium]|nr:hypothetical protein [Bacteroidales bacterium]
MSKFLTLLLSALLCFQTLSAQTKQRISVLGDSYSTFEGYIPEGNEPWYFQKIDTSRSDVLSVRQTWWWQLIKDGGYLLEKNESYSGATISYTGYNDDDYSPRSFITRLPRVGSPDILLIFGCTNDSWAGVKTGQYQYSDFKRGDLYFYRPALAKLLEEALSRLPNVDIYFIINSELRSDIVESTITICKHYGIKYIQLENIEKRWGHPTAKGMKSIATQVAKAIK